MCFIPFTIYITYLNVSAYFTVKKKRLIDHNLSSYMNTNIVGRCSPSPRSVFPGIGGTPTEDPKILNWPKLLLYQGSENFAYRGRGGRLWGFFWAQSALPRMHGWFFMAIFPLIGRCYPTSPYAFPTKSKMAAKMKVVGHKNWWKQLFSKK